MPFIPTSTSGFMLAKGLGAQLTGEKFQSFVSAVSNALCQYLQSAPLVNSTNIVIGPGAGTYMATITGCVPDAMSALMMTKAAGSNIIGRDIKKLFDAVSFGACNTLLSMVISQGTVIGGGPGAGQGKIVNLVPNALQALIMAQLAAKAFTGSKLSSVVEAISFGICNHIMSAATVITTCIGSFTPPPVGPVTIPAAPGIGRLM